MQLSIITIGKFGKGPERDLYQTYQKRIVYGLSLVEIPQQDIRDKASRLAREEKSIRSHLDKDLPIISLSEHGHLLSSRGFAEYYQNQLVPRGGAQFLIGGPDGLPPNLIEQADLVWSFGRLTWPHLLMRTLLAEQLYRTQSILQNHPYHRD